MELTNPLHLIIDEGTGALSMSRLCLGAINLMALAAAAVMLIRGQNPTALLVGVAASDASVYAFNSGLNSYRSVVTSVSRGITE